MHKTRGIGAAYEQDSKNPPKAPEEVEEEKEERNRLVDTLEAFAQEKIIETRNFRMLPIEQLRTYRAEATEVIRARNAEQDHAYLSRMLPAPKDPKYIPLFDAQRRQRIEAALEPLDLSQLLFKRYVEQVVPVRNGLSYTLRSLPGLYEDWIHRILSKELQGTESEMVINNRFSLYRTAATLVAINGEPLRGVGESLHKLQQESEFATFSDLLKMRVSFLQQLPAALLEDLAVQVIWFQGRIRALLADDAGTEVGKS